MKKIVVGLALAVILVIIVSAAALLLVDVNRYRGAVQAQLERQLGRDIRLGKMTLGILPLRFEVENPVIAEDPNFSSAGPFIRAEKLDTRVSLSSLLGRNLEIQSIDLERPTLELIRNKRGDWNFSTFGAGGTPADAESRRASSERGFSLERLSIHDGQVALTDLPKTQGRTLLDHIDVTSRLTAVGNTTTAAGNLKLNAARFNGVDLGYPISVDYDVALKRPEGLLAINRAKVLVGQTLIDVAGSLTTKTTPAELDLVLKTGDVSITEIARLASAFGIAFAPGTSVSGRMRADLKATGSTSKPALTGKIAGQNLKISSKDVAQPVEVKAIELTLSPAEIGSNDFNATSGKTNVAARFAVRQYTSPSPSIDMELHAPNATLPEIQSIAKAYGIKGLDQVNGSGNLNMEIRAAGPLQSFTSENLIKALNGTMGLNFNDLRIAGFDLAHELGVIGGFAASSSDNQKFTDIIKLAGQIAVSNGVARTDDLKAQMALGEVSATGTGDLSSEALNVKLLAVLSKAFTDKVGGGRIGGYMRTAFANTAGEMVIPVVVTGTFKQPRFAPDTRAIVEMQKQRLIPGFQPGQKPSDTIKGIIGGFFGGKK
ncbi:MAG: hypothetical protein DMG15_23350 [Acidobacteria bacterium]|nr:MAG: hypothetical protein DMG15_23350 [Acidobacteriota bacterium]